MISSGKTLYYFSFYVFVMGILLLFVPDFIVTLLKLPVLPTGWGRMFGLLVLIIGSYDFLTGKYNVQPLVKATVYMRIAFAIGIVMLIVLDQMPIAAIGVALPEVLSSIWTALALKAEAEKV